MLHGVTRCYMVLHGITWCYTVLHRVKRCYTVLLGVTWFYSVLYGVTQSFRFEDDNDYEYDIFSVLSSARAGASVILAGKSDSRRHSTTGFSKSGGNKLLNVGSFFILQ